MEILNFAKTLREIATKYDINVVDANMPDEGTLAKQIDDMNDENRLLKIGIIGRVKSGKSSLINALVFNGRDILPKAATPMTAALTMLEYGENLAGEVEFYTDEDLKKIKDKFDSYQRQLKEQTNKEFENLKAQSKIPNLSASKLDELKIKAEQIVINKLKENISLSGAADQWERIEKTGIKLDDLKDNGKIVAKNIDELNRKLYDFVGANGKYMPFTKSVKLTLNEPNLKDINIVDTPGVNDPIPSREERTKALLATCDVVLIVSPAGQFLSEQDTKLLHRVNTKDGIKEIYLIASQADTQIFSDEKEKANGNLHDALTNITRTLSKTQRNVLKDYKLDNPSIKNALDDLIDNDVILSSSVAFTLLQNWDKKSSWDENSAHVWQNLQKHYNAYFADENSAKANLEKLAGISAVKEILSEVRTRKDEIKAQKTAEFNQVEMKKLLDFKTSAINFINEDIERIKNTDLDKLQSDIAKMKANKSRAIMAVNDAWEDMVIDSGLHIKEVIYNKIEKHFKDLIGEINSAQRTRSKTRSYEVEVKDNGWSNLFGLFGDRYKTETRHKTITIQTVNASEIYSALSDVTDDAQELISGSFEKELKDFKKQAYSTIVGSARKAVDDDNILDPVLITHIVKGIMNSIEIPEPKFEGVPSSLRQSGDLDEDEGRKYMDDAKDYARNLEQSLKSKTSDAIKTLSSTLRSREVGSEMFAQYTKNIEQLQSDLCNKEEAISHKEMILEELESAG